MHLPVLQPLGIIVATFIPHIFSSYRHTSDIVTRADFDAQYAPIKGIGARPTIKFVRPHLILTILNNCGEIHSLTSKYYGKQSFKMNKNNNVTKCEITMQPTSYIVELKLFNRGIRANIEVPGGVQMLTKICREKIQNSSSQEQLHKKCKYLH